LTFKDESDEAEDSEERAYLKLIKEEREFEENLEDDEHQEGSYDSELENDFFGKKDTELNTKLGNRINSDDEGDNQIDSKAGARKKFNPADFRENLPEDVNRALIHMQRFKPAEGVEFRQYDQFGFSLDPDNELRKYLAVDGDDEGFEYLPPSEE
jgi:hypothetical protein